MAECRIASTTLEAGDRWRTHVVGVVRASVRPPAELAQALAVEDVSRRCTEFVPRERYYQAIRASGLEYGQSFQGIQILQRGLGEVLTKVQLPDSLRADRNKGPHPALLIPASMCFPPSSMNMEISATLLAPLAPPICRLGWKNSIATVRVRVAFGCTLRGGLVTVIRTY